MMDELVLITKTDCQKCDYLKGKIEQEDLNVKLLDSKSVDGMVKLAYHELMDESNHMPILIINDSEHITGDQTIHILKKIRDSNGKKQ